MQIAAAMEAMEALSLRIRTGERAWVLKPTRKPKEQLQAST
jgi:hypothetical protein